MVSCFFIYSHVNVMIFHMSIKFNMYGINHNGFKNQITDMCRNRKFPLYYLKLFRRNIIGVEKTDFSANSTRW